MTQSRCRSPLSLNELADYWVGDVSPEKEDVVEEHLLACDVCSQGLEEVAELAGNIGRLVRKGATRGIVTGSFVDRLAGEGLRVREYRLAPGGQVPCTVTYEDDLVIGRLCVDLTGRKQVDFIICDAQGNEEERWRDIPFSPSTSEIIFTERADTLRALPPTTLRVRLVSVGDEGERLLGEYTFNHTPSV
jgi:hypothetical protein